MCAATYFIICYGPLKLLIYALYSESECETSRLPISETGNFRLLMCPSGKTVEMAIAHVTYAFYKGPLYPVSQIFFGFSEFLFRIIISGHIVMVYTDLQIFRT